MEGESSSFKAPISFVDIHILVVDDDPIALSVLSAMLRTCKYQVVTAKNSFEALDTLRTKKGMFDLVISDLHMPQMNGLELQNKVRQEFDLPVVMISADEKESAMLESLEKGAAFYIVKPVKVDDLKHVWQHAVAAKKGKSKVSSLMSSIAIRNYARNGLYNDNMSPSFFGNDESKRFNLKRKASSSKWYVEKNSHPPKRAKVVWTNSLHNRFLHALRQIGLDKAVPKRILQFMNVPGLTRENVASHLQKYRLFLKRVTDDGFLPMQGFSDTTSGTSLLPFLPPMVSQNLEQNDFEFPKLWLLNQPSNQRSNPRNPNFSIFSAQKPLLGSSITHFGQVLIPSQFHSSDVLTRYAQNPDMFINNPSIHLEGFAYSPTFSSSAYPFSNAGFSGLGMHSGEDNPMITGQIGFNGSIVGESSQFLSSLPNTNQYDDTVFVQTSPLQSYDPLNEDREEDLTEDDVCRLFIKDNDNLSAFEQKDEKESLSDLCNVLDNESNLDVLSAYSTTEDGSARGKIDEKDTSIGENMDPIPPQPSKQIEEEIQSLENHGVQKEENGSLASPNEGWDNDLLEILFGDNVNERDLQIHLSEIFGKR